MAAGAALAAPPQRVGIDYEFRRNGSAVAEVSERLEHDGRTYRLSQTWKGKGIYAIRGEARRSSTGAVGPEGLRPEAFEDHRPGKDPRRASPGAGAQDRLSVLWHFAFKPPVARVTLQVTDGRGVSTHVYDPAGRERIQTPAGEFQALKLERRDDDRRAQVWFAPERGNVPVRVLVAEKDGTLIEVIATRISQ
ncbi:MAG: DUF3108 domain-containing protein [Betaproteobacteria bacterium]